MKIYRFNNYLLFNKLSVYLIKNILIIISLLDGIEGKY